MDKIDTAKYLQRVITVSWIALIVCFIIKLFGGNLFEIVCTNENFIKVCKYADTHLWAYYFIGAVYCFISLYFFILAILQRTKYKKWEFCMLIATVLIGSAIKIWNNTIGLVFDVWQFIILPFIFFKGNIKCILRIIIANILLIAFQSISVIIKNIDYAVLTNNGTLINSIFSIDVILMVILYFAYSNILKNKKDKK